MKKIAFFDSGIGGIPYLLHLRSICKDFDCIYLADNKNFPYGTKGGEEIKNIVLAAVEKLIEKTSPDIIVIACNTASVVTLPCLREKYDIPFVGVVPAVKTAANNSGNKRIGLFATNKTVSDSYTDNLLSSFADDCLVYKFADPNIVSFVEQKLLEASEEEILEILKPAADYFTEKNVDYVILGCTHFLFIDKYLEKLFPENIKTIDSREGVSKQILRLSGFHTTASCNKKNSVKKGEFYVTIENNNYEKIAEQFFLEYRGVI